MEDIKVAESDTAISASGTEHILTGKRRGDYAEAYCQFSINLLLAQPHKTGDCASCVNERDSIMRERRRKGL